MRRYSLLILCGLASLYGLWRGLHLAFLPVAMQGRVTPGRGEVTEPVFWGAGIPILVVLVVIYAALGHALYTRQYAVFRLIGGVHIFLSLLSFASVGFLFLPSSGLLLLAIVLSFLLPEQGGSQSTL